MASADGANEIAPKSILESLTLKGAMAMAVAFVAGKFGPGANDPMVQTFAEALVNLVFYGGLLAVGIGRARARGPLSSGGAR